MGIRIIKHNRNNAKDTNCLLLEVDTTGVDDKYGIVYSKEKQKFIVEPVRTGITSGEHDEITQNIFNNYYNFTKQKSLSNVFASKDEPQIVNIEVPETKDYNFGKLELLKYVEGTNKKFQIAFTSDSATTHDADYKELIDFNNSIKLRNILEYDINREDVSYNSKYFDYKYYYNIYNLELLENNVPISAKNTGYLFLIQDLDGKIYTYSDRNLILLNTLKLTDKLFIEHGFNDISSDLYLQHSKELYFPIKKIKSIGNTNVYKTPINIVDILSINGSAIIKSHDGIKISPIQDSLETSIISVIQNSEELDTLKLNASYEPILKNKKLLVYHKDNDKKLKLRLKIFPKPQKIFSTSDIDLDFVDKILKINFNVIGDKNIKYLFSVDSGYTWYSCIEGILKDAKLEEIDKFGMQTKDFNDIEKETWNKILNDNNKIRFAYHIDIKNSNDISELKSIQIAYKSKGEYASLIQGKDYDYSYVNEKTLSLKIYSNGIYKINYYHNNNSLKDNKVLLQWEEFDL